MYDFLKKIPLFSSLPDEDLERLCEMVTEVSLPAGAELFSEGSPGDTAYVIEEGEIEIMKASGGRMVLLAVRKSGEVIGEMSLLEAAPRFATGRARTDSLLLAIGHSQLNHLLNTSPSAARAMLFTVTSRLRTTELLLRDSEKMAQLGTLTAGIAHELNNPAAAVQRGSGQLLDLMLHLRESQVALDKSDLTDRQQEKISQLEKDILTQAEKPIEIDPLSRSDKEYDLETWLDEKEIENAWELAPVLVNLSIDLEELENLANDFSAQELAIIISWLGTSYTVYSLLAEINQGAERISEIVKSLKSYVYLDQAPIQSIDIQEGLDNTLVMLRHKLKAGINVKREYAPELPHIQAYGSELNQVWTNIIDNAIDAMNGKGEIILRTRQEGEWVFVEIDDNGPGIPGEILDKIFSPFFTTKPVGKGTGLGLNISYNIIKKHGGEVKVQSQPGKTRFQICLPVNFEKVSSGENPVFSMENPTDHALLRILETTNTIAVVGISNRQEQPNYSVPAYLQEAGYRIIPVNPNLKEVLGEKSYPDLLSISEPIDTVLIFRRSEAVPEIVDQAIQIGARVVWMQEGVINETAAAKAKNAGLEVVMDTCMRATHKRLK
jgi:signal transduction histidine kinase/predicted CoA-binding protein